MVSDKGGSGYDNSGGYRMTATAVIVGKTVTMIVDVATALEAASTVRYMSCLYCYIV